MLRFLVRRAIGMLFVFFFVSMISFWLVSLFPGDYYTTSVVQFALSGMSRSEAFQAREALRSAAGLDKSWLGQYFVWFSGILRYGNFGVPWDFLFHPSNGLGWTVVVVITSAIVALLFGIPIGILSAVRRGTWLDHLFTSGTFTALAIPQFVWAWIIYGVIRSLINANIGTPPVWGLVSYTLRSHPLSWTKALSHFLHLIPAWILVGTPMFATIVRTLRVSLIDTFHEHYLRSARGKGLSETRVILRHAFRNALNPLISTTSVMLPTLLVGSILLSPVLGMPTFERVFLDALKRQNQRVITVALVFYSLFLLFGNLFADLLLIRNDPRIRYD